MVFYENKIISVRKCFQKFNFKRIRIFYCYFNLCKETETQYSMMSYSCLSAIIVPCRALGIHLLRVLLLFFFQVQIKTTLLWRKQNCIQYKISMKKYS